MVGSRFNSNEKAEVFDIPFPPFLDLTGRQLCAIIRILIFMVSPIIGDQHSTLSAK